MACVEGAGGMPSPARAPSAGDEASPLEGVQALLSTVLRDEVLLDYVSQVICDGDTDTDAAWETLEPYLLDAEVAPPVCRAVQLQLALMLPPPSERGEQGAQPLGETITLSDLWQPVRVTLATVEQDDPALSVDSSLQYFEPAYRGFRERYGKLIHENIAGCWPGELQLLDACLSPELQLRFVRGAFGGKRPKRGLSDRAVCKLLGAWIPVLHGTDARNHESIFWRGLLIPGKGNELKVVHGARDGPGVYTAGLHAAWLSKGFCTERRMLICAVLRGGKLKYARDAIVVVDSSHVVPLFEAVWVEPSETEATPSPAPAS